MSDHKIIHEGEPGWPAAMPAGGPRALVYRGDLSLLEREHVAITGNFEEEVEGYSMFAAQHLTADLVDAKIPVITGGNVGIEDSAVAVAIASKAKPVVVTASAHEVVHFDKEARFRTLRLKQIAKAGLLVAPYDPDGSWADSPREEVDAIIHAVSGVVVVVQAAEGGSAYASARRAVAAGRKVVALPGLAYRAESAGCNILIQEGAPLVTDGAQVIAHLNSTAA